MIRSVIRNFKCIINHKTILNPSVASKTLFRRFECTQIPENHNKNDVRKYREAEVHFWHALGYKCMDPSEITEEQWQHLCGLDTKHQRKRYCRYLLVRKEAQAEKKEAIAKAKEMKKGNRDRVLSERESNQHINSQNGQNSLHLRVTSQTVNKWFNSKLHFAKLFGQKLVIDCSYEKYMTNLERSKVNKQLMKLYSENRRHPKPFDLHFCGMKSDGTILKNLNGQIPTLLSKSSPTEVHSECFTQLFPKERLVMLTLDSDDVLDYNFDDIYIIGGIVDFGRNEPLTLAKAKKLGIRSARLPLDDVRTESGDSRELPLASVARVLRELQISSNWNEIIDKCVYFRSKYQKQNES